ncbi:MAG: CpsB/CapC family capsule biosynthesis tyrosine phosphatase, partial [Ignavibacteria bacterium]|nr:CpsB/CapC family capsule biosynthesis tyrosine phosphatase [Ignavibacteria bacterium]
KELYPNTPATVQTALSLVQQSLQQSGSAVQIAAGAEYMIDGDFELGNDLLCLKDKYLLIEMSYLNETPNIDQIIFDLQIKGYKVVLAHPERYNFYHQNHARYHRLREMGCLFQLNLLAVTGYYGKAVKVASEYLLNKKLYDLAGTDLHHDKHLAALDRFVKNGNLYHILGKYEFKNKQLFV